MSQNGQNNDKRPSLMLIMRSVAQAAGMTTADIMGGRRHAGLCHARAAVYKIAARHGYPKDEIMYFLDRIRTVAYNYEGNINGYLQGNAAFKTLCATAMKIIESHPHRAAKPQAATAPEATPGEPREPFFTDHKSLPGWSFTAAECRRMWYAEQAARRFMATYGQPPRIEREERPQVCKVPEEMQTEEAAAYIGAGPNTLLRGVKLGMLQRFKKPGCQTFWYYTAELDSFREYREQAKNKDKH